ncbi:PREDICTED: uncharacterized protein LOC109337067 [Lupinus angustifolius]|uniref:uncharacterized protein LOC109337067 n=1 Tax=Lupinus angustifolius TaxID=3871 RepID=UPI00092F80AA|nr:PREDICTED: uncharacterized protein LOC109337067 [Lupinus angustifolius]
MGKELVDLGASVSLMSLPMMRRTEGIQLKSTRMSLQIVDRSIKYQDGVVEDVLVKVDRFLILVNFVVIGIYEDVEIALVLGRPFMRTVKMGIDMENGKMKVHIDNEEIQFEIFEAKHHPIDKG